MENSPPALGVPLPFALHNLGGQMIAAGIAACILLVAAFTRKRQKG